MTTRATRYKAFDPAPAKGQGNHPNTNKNAIELNCSMQGGRAMSFMDRRALLCTSLGAAAGAVLTRPYVAKAQAKTATIWVGPGLRPGRGRRVKKDSRGLRESIRQQDRLQHHAVHGAEPEVDLRADQRGCPGPDLSRRAVETILPQNAWHDRLVDVSDVVETQKSKLS